MSVTDIDDPVTYAPQAALNDVLRALCADRPRLLVHGSPAFVPATSLSATRQEAMPYPGIAGGIEWRMRVEVPRIDLFGATDELPAALTPGAGRFRSTLVAELCLDLRRDIASWCDLDLSVLGHLELVRTTGEACITFAVDAVEIVDVARGHLEPAFERVVTVIVQAVMGTMQVPMRVLRAAAPH